LKNFIVTTDQYEKESKESEKGLLP